MSTERIPREQVVREISEALEGIPHAYPDNYCSAEERAEKIEVTVPFRDDWEALLTARFGRMTSYYPELHLYRVDYKGYIIILEQSRNVAFKAFFAQFGGFFMICFSILLPHYNLHIDEGGLYIKYKPLSEEEDGLMAHERHYPTEKIIPGEFRLSSDITRVREFLGIDYPEGAVKTLTDAIELMLRSKWLDPRPFLKLFRPGTGALPRDFALLCSDKCKGLKPLGEGEIIRDEVPRALQFFNLTTAHQLLQQIEYDYEIEVYNLNRDYGSHSHLDNGADLRMLKADLAANQSLCEERLKKINLLLSRFHENPDITTFGDFFEEFILATSGPLRPELSFHDHLAWLDGYTLEEAEAEVETVFQRKKRMAHTLTQSATWVD